jgi:hypothetical protein
LFHKSVPTTAYVSAEDVLFIPCLYCYVILRDFDVLMLVISFREDLDNHLTPSFKVVKSVRRGPVGIRGFILSAVALSFAFKMALSQVLYVLDCFEL